jgi:hypothetical protein
MWNLILNYFLKIFLLKVIIRGKKFIAPSILVFKLYNLKITDIFINFVQPENNGTLKSLPKILKIPKIITKSAVISFIISSN